MDPSTLLFEQAQQLMPGGVNSPVRSFSAVGGTPRFIVRASDCYLYDAAGCRYIDYIGSWGPMIAGHAHPAVIDAITQTARLGTSFGTPSPLEIELAREITERAPTIEKIRMVNSGTEATMGALRLARAATRRDRILKFAGCYHGHVDGLLVQAGSGAATLGVPDSPGVTRGAAQDTLVACYNDLNSVQRLFAESHDSIAAVIVEPIAGNMGVVLPADGFLAGLREITREHGALLIFDEVMTGFRVARGGAQALFGVTPDLTTFGKVIGGGLPVGAYGGPAWLMDQIAPAGPVYQAGTLSGNPLAMAAGLATLRLLDSDAYQLLDNQSALLADGLRAAAQFTGIPIVVQRAGSMLTLFFSDRPVRNFAQARCVDHQRFARFFQGMLDRGVHLPPSGYEAWFVSLAHDGRVIEQTLEAARETLAVLLS